MDPINNEATAVTNEANQGKNRRQRREANPLPLKLALRRGKSTLKVVFNLLHNTQEINGLDPGEKFHARGDLEDAKHTMEKIQTVISRLEKLLE